VAANSNLALPRTYLAATVAASASFQTWTGTLNATAALTRIFYEETTPDKATPIAIVTSNNFRRDKIAGGTRNYFEGHGDLYLFFRDVVLLGESAVDADVQNALDTFENNVGNVINDLEALAGQAGYLDIEHMHPEGPVARVEFQEAKAVAAGSFWESFWIVEFRSL
jgi:hypothetical protein